MGRGHALASLRAAGGRARRARRSDETAALRRAHEAVRRARGGRHLAGRRRGRVRVQDGRPAGCLVHERRPLDRTLGRIGEAEVAHERQRRHGHAARVLARRGAARISRDGAAGVRIRSPARRRTRLEDEEGHHDHRGVGPLARRARVVARRSHGLRHGRRPRPARSLRHRRELGQGEPPLRPRHGVQRGRRGRSPRLRPRRPAAPHRALDVGHERRAGAGHHALERREGRVHRAGARPSSSRSRAPGATRCTRGSCGRRTHRRAPACRSRSSCTAVRRVPSATTFTTDGTPRPSPATATRRSWSTSTDRPATARRSPTPSAATGAGCRSRT